MNRIDGYGERITNLFAIPGGPLVYKGELIGVTSWAYLCALGIPDGFCRVSEYVPWIEEQINSTRTQPLLPQLN